MLKSSFIKEAVPSFVPAAVNAAGGVVACAAQVRFKVVLEDGVGNSVRIAAGTSASKTTSTKRSDVGTLVESAVESMFEQVAKDLFANPGK